MTIIQENELLTYIREIKLPQVIDSNNDRLTDAEETAISIVRDHLAVRYDLEQYLSGTQAMPKWLKRIIINIMLHLLYERIPDKLVPERIRTNYDESMLAIRELADGIRESSLLPQLLPDGNSDTKFKWGGNPPNN